MIKKLKSVSIVPMGKKDDFGDYKVPKELWEKTFTGVKDKTKTYTVCEVNVIPADDSPELAGEFIKVTFWPYEDKKNKKITPAIDKAKYWIEKNKGQDVMLDITERHYTSKTKEAGIAYEGKTLSKKAAEVAAQFVK